MIAAQMIGTHNAAMECLRRAMLPERTFEGRNENLRQASKLSRAFAALVEARERYRGKGQQKVVSATDDILERVLAEAAPHGGQLT